ncbi:MAG: hypothetical protein NC930_04185, partial [Candidatus Omnitrophica bacterium]|nr:hypothetical protein [Candidatus Omnitrophota bacterium]
MKRTRGKTFFKKFPHLLSLAFLRVELWWIKRLIFCGFSARLDYNWVVDYVEKLFDLFFFLSVFF